MGIDWEAFQSGLENDIRSCCTAESWDDFAAQLAEAVKNRLDTALTQARVNFQTGNVNGQCPSGGGPLQAGNATNGTII
jgi:hypothetical protein